jgi:signal transduction histidine kinase
MRLTHTAAAAALTAVAISIPCGAWYWLGSRQIARESAQLEQAAAREASFAAKQLAARLALRLDDLREEEGDRPAVHYWPRYLGRGDGCAHVQMHASPLAEKKKRHPVMAHFQIDEAGRVSGPRADKVINPADLASLDDVLPSTRQVLLTTAVSSPAIAPAAGAPPPAAGSPPTSAGRDGELPRADEGRTVAPFRWQTGKWKGKTALIALRHVELASRRYTQGFAVDSGCLSHWMFDGGFPAKMVAGRPVRDTDAAVPIAGTAWHVSVDARPAIAAARAQGAILRRQFRQSYLGGLLGATFAGACVVALVRRSGKLARERSRFAAAAAHELRTPLAGIRLHGEMLAHSLGNPARIQQYSQRIADEAERLGRLVANVLAHSQVEQSRLRLRTEPGDLGAAVREGLVLLEPMVAAAGAHLEVQVAEDLPKVPFDRDAVHQIVRNLVDNAEKYSRGAGDRRIAVDIRPADDGAGGAVLEVRDHGPGIPMRQRRDLFRPFSRPDDGVSAPDGLGLGLAVVRSLALAHGGTVTVTDTPGGGATFTVQFPATSAS